MSEDIYIYIMWEFQGEEETKQTKKLPKDKLSGQLENSRASLSKTSPLENLQFAGGARLVLLSILSFFSFL